MSDSNSVVLQRAYELVEAGQADEARSLVESVLESEQANPDAWWIYAHAVEDPMRARQALDQVLALDPQYPGAADLSDVLEEQYPGAAEAARQAGPLLLRGVPGTETGEDNDLLIAAAAAGAAGIGAEALGAGNEDAELSADEEPGFVGQLPPATVVAEKEERRGVAWYWYFAGAAAVVLLLALILLLLRPAPSTLVIVTDATDSTMVVGLPTLDAGAQAGVETALPVVGDATAESTEAPGATSEPLLPSVIATLPESMVVTLTPLPAGQPTESIAEVTVAPDGQPATDAAVPTSESGLPTSDSGLPTTDTALPTSDTALPTDATAQPTALEPQATATVGPAGVNLPEGVLPFDELNALVADLSAVPAPETALTNEATPLGETMVASFCTEDGPELRDLTRQVMDKLAVRAEVMEPGMNAVGARAVDCGTGETLRLIAVDRGAAQAFSDGAITRELYESQWLAF
ncbi:MAG TPA: hypothetical protein VER79_13915 [Candidatus Limnocylindrales bacterium]|nr:hypothetical protein [Candidatus Limnocylindrales bacterium]